VRLSDQTEVEVLGTHFNIMAYGDETTTYTTLLEGAVKINKGSLSKTIVPGEQAVVSSDLNNINIKRVDLDGVVAWKNGLFMFKNENIQSIMKKISRWYNVDVTYTGDISKKVFAGTVSRFENVSEVLEMLELTGSIHFKVEGRRITVMP
jgi:transmembrane sensor